jgi:hypothetical protein
MPCKDGKEAMNARDEEPPCTLPSPTQAGNGEAGGSESDGQMDSDYDSDEDLQDGKKKKKWNGRREFTLTKAMSDGRD